MASWPRIVLAVTYLAAISCTGDAALGRERATLAPPPEVRDAGVDAPVEPPSGTDSGLQDAGRDPLVLEFRVGTTAMTELRVSCPEACVRVELSAHGGTPPYDFSWDDASTNPQRLLCASTDTTFHALVHDARGGSQAHEIVLHYTPCSVGQVCLKNPSLEGPTTFGAEWFSNAFDASPWDACRSSDDARAASAKIVASGSGDEFPAPSEGDSYLYLESTSMRHRNVGQALCGPLEVGSVYSFKVDLAGAAEDFAGAGLGPVQVEVYASSGPCQRDELVWTSPRLSTGWRTFCLTFKPTKNATALVLNVMGPGTESSAAFIDHLVPVDGCP
jgi:hypothetical protein